MYPGMHLENTKTQTCKATGHRQTTNAASKGDLFKTMSCEQLRLLIDEMKQLEADGVVSVRLAQMLSGDPIVDAMTLRLAQS